MALIVGNLLTDPAAQSFISLDDAEAYLGIENIEAWQTADAASKEAALVRASRWLVATFQFRPLDDEGLARVGQVAARLAAETIAMPIFTGTSTSNQKKRVKAGSVEVEYHDSTMTAQAAGTYWPWLLTMLRGLIVSPDNHGWAIVV